MRRAIIKPIVILALTASWAGCGSSSAVDLTRFVAGPHAESALRLPDGLGYVECQLEGEAGARAKPEELAGSRGRRRFAIAAYFLGPDAKSALSPSPSAARIDLNTDARVTRRIDLAARPKAGDPAGGSRFISPPDQYGTPRSLSGRLIFAVDGREVSVPLYVR